MSPTYVGYAVIIRALDDLACGFGGFEPDNQVSGRIPVVLLRETVHAVEGSGTFSVERRREGGGGGRGGVVARRA